METPEKKEISVEDEAVDKTIFKDCGKIAFYRRQKQQLSKNTTYRASLDSVGTEQDSTRFQISRQAPGVLGLLESASSVQFENCSCELNMLLLDFELFL